MRKHIFKVFIIMLACGVTLSSCTHLTSKTLAAQALTSCLPTCRTYELNGETFRELETDSYGRVLLAYKVNSYLWPFYFEDTVAVLVLQEYDKNNVYYYDDLFYVFFNDCLINKIDLSNSKILELKEANDWNNPLNSDKMSSREISVTLDNVSVRKFYDGNEYDSSEFLNEVELYFKSNYNYTNESFELICVDYDDEIKELCLAMWKTSENDYDLYFVIHDVRGGFSVMKIYDMYNYQQDLASFKKANDWNY